MRYSVFFKKAEGEKTCVYNTTSPDLMLALMNPKVHLAADSAGTFECSLNPKSPAMSEDILERMATKVMIQEYKDHVPNEYVTNSEEEAAEHAANKEKVLFYGRLLSIDKDFYNTPSLYCEGALSFLNDTVIMPYTMPKTNPEGSEEYTQYGKYFTPAQALQKFLAEHNAAVTRGGSEQGIKFETNIENMTVTMKDDLFSGEKNDGSGEEIDNFVVSTYTNTLEVLNNLKKTYGGKFRVRYRPVLPSDKVDFGAQMAIPILDWIADFDNTKQGTELPGAQSYIEFGKNLLDLTQKTDGSNIVNCLFMTGKKIASAKGAMIGDEIDVAPMCYYWMVKINRVSHDASSDANWDSDYGQYYAVQNGAYVLISSLGLNKPPKTTLNDQSTERGDYIGPYYGAETTPSIVTSDPSQDQTSTNVHDLRFFANVKEGAIYRDPVNLDELEGITPSNPDISHMYRILSSFDATTESNWDTKYGQYYIKRNGSNILISDLGLTKPPKTTAADTTQNRGDYIGPYYNATWYLWRWSGDGQGDPVGSWTSIQSDKSGNPSYQQYGNWTEEDCINGNLIETSGNVTVTFDYGSSLIFDRFKASSRGLGWAQGYLLDYVGGQSQISFAQRWEYSSTGFWDSGSKPSWVGTGPHTTLGVNPGDSFYASYGGYSTTGEDALTTVLYIVTEGYLINNGTVIMTTSRASSANGTFEKFKKITIPTPEKTSGTHYYYLNFSSKTAASNNAGYISTYPSTRAQLNLQLWKTRTPAYDEYVTLYGIAQGYPKWYLDTEKYTENGTEKSRDVLKIPKRVKQLMVGTVDEEQWFVYDSENRLEAGYQERSYEDRNAFPEDSSDIDTNAYYIDRSTGDVWIYKDDIWTYLPLAHAYKVNSYGVEDPVSIAKYGRIEKIVNFDNCSDPSTLRDLGAKTLFEARLEGLELNVTALDLSLLDNNIDSPDVLDMISIRSVPHHVGEPDPSKPQFTLPLSERDIPLNDPAQQQYSIGYTGTRKITKTYAWTRR